MFSFTAPATGKYYIHSGRYTSIGAMKFLGEDCAPAVCSQSPYFDAVEGHTYYFALEYGDGYPSANMLILAPSQW